MKHLFSFAIIIATGIVTNAQIKTLSPSVPNKIAVNSKILKVASLKLNPAILADRKMKLGASSFTNPSFTRPLTSDNTNVTYKLKPASLSDNSNTSSVSSTPASPPAQSGYTCTSTREKVTANSTDFLSVSQNGDGIYPGAIYRYDDFYKANFKNTDVSGWQRNPIIISSDAAQSTSVANPTADQLSNAVVSLKNATPADPGAIVTSQYTYSNNSTVLALNATAGGAYAGFSGAAGFSFNKSDSSIYITYDYRVILFTLNASIPNNGFFTDPTKEQTQNLIWLGSVSYGARILANVKINASQLKIGANAKFQYGDASKAGFQAAADFTSGNQSLTCTINTYTVGLPASATIAASMSTTLADLDQQIRNALRAVTSQTAKPVMYSLYSMAGDRIAVESATDYYTNTLCLPADAVYHLTDASVDLITGAGAFDDKLAGSVGKVELKCCGGITTVRSAQSNTKIDPKATTNFPLTTGNTPIILQDLKNSELRITLIPTNILGVYDEWRIVGATLKMNLADQRGTPYPGNPIQLQIPGVGSGVILSKTKPVLYSKIMYNSGSTTNGGFTASTANQQ